MTNCFLTSYYADYEVFAYPVPSDVHV